MNKKQVKKYGDSLVIVLNKDDIQWHNIKEGDWVDIGDIVKLKKEVKK